MSEQEFVSVPVMHGMRALVKRPEDYLVAPKHGNILALGAAPDPERPGRGLLYIGMHDVDGSALFAIISEEQLPQFADLMSEAGRRVRDLDFEQPEAGRA